MAQLVEMLRPLGLHRRRASSIVSFSKEFLRGEWKKPEDLPGVGKYGADAFRIFCRGEWEGVQPKDHALVWYCEWLKSTSEYDA